MGHEHPSRELLTAWVAGVPAHDRDNGCVPDFSCCMPHLLAPQELREEYAAANPARRAALERYWQWCILTELGRPDDQASRTMGTSAEPSAE